MNLKWGHVIASLLLGWALLLCVFKLVLLIVMWATWADLFLWLLASIFTVAALWAADER